MYDVYTYCRPICVHVLCTVVQCTHYLHVIGCRTFYLMYRSDHSSHHCNWIYGDYLKYIFVLLIFIHFLYFRGSLCSIGVWTSPRLSPSSKLNLLWSWGLWSYPKNCTMTFVAYNSAENFVRLHEREVQGMPARHCSRRSCWLIVNWISLGKLETTQKLTSHIVPASPNSPLRSNLFRDKTLGLSSILQIQCYACTRPTSSCNLQSRAQGFRSG